MQRRHNLQFVWPKDGHRGRGHRGFWGRLNNIATGKGPDVFIQRKGSKEPIMQDQWQNWDSYASFNAHMEEESYPASRGFERYDPYTRTYKEWSIPHDWYGIGVDGSGVGGHGVGLPMFTRDEQVHMHKERLRGRQIDPGQMGSEWNNMGPKRWRTEHDEFWRNAHRQSENRRLNRPMLAGLNPLMYIHQRHRDELLPWFYREGVCPP
ncbi:hypothetical protein BKA65DRAFT_543517 [Rhexocercosporidium sp. MPI-PUGE-AT-0058]|nr:hypothetical protein BKA65DRAFT_543517 [Rhexocercosporidium sp. MPI-PUGE-AT-0058]